jgi:hypothetical protein
MMIEKIIDPSAPPEERAQRTRRLSAEIVRVQTSANEFQLGVLWVSGVP